MIKDEIMKKKDSFRDMLGIKLLDARDGYAKMTLGITKNHVNALDLAHGGAIFSLADCAFAEAANFGDHVALAVRVDIDFLKPAFQGDLLTAEAQRVSEGKTFDLYHVTIRNQDKLVAFFSGLAYKK